MCLNRVDFPMNGYRDAAEQTDRRSLVLDGLVRRLRHDILALQSTASSIRKHSFIGESFIVVGGLYYGSLVRRVVKGQMQKMSSSCNTINVLNLSIILHSYYSITLHS